MTRTIIAGAALAFFGALPANATIDLVQVPAACGTMKEVASFLSVKMPGAMEIGSGADKRGAPIATLFTGRNGYWALVATMSSEQVCVIASGREWTMGPVQAKSY